MSTFYEEVKDEFKDPADELIEKAETVQGGVSLLTFSKSCDDNSNEEETNDGTYTVDDIDEGQDEFGDEQDPYYDAVSVKTEATQKASTNSGSQVEPLLLGGGNSLTGCGGVHGGCNDQTLGCDTSDCEKDSNYCDAKSGIGRTKTNVPGYSKINKVSTINRTEASGNKSDLMQFALNSGDLSDKISEKRLDSEEPKTESCGSEGKSNSSSGSSSQYPWMQKPYVQDPHPLPGLAKSSVYEVVGHFEKPKQPDHPSGSQQFTSSHDSVAKKVNEVNDHLRRSPLPGLQSDQFELASCGGFVYDLAQPITKVKKDKNRKHQYDPPWTDDLFVNPNIVTKMKPQQSDDRPRQATPEKSGREPLEQPLYDTPLELTISGNYDHLTGRMKKASQEDRGEHTYGVGSGKNIEFSMSTGTGHHKKYRPNVDATQKQGIPSSSNNGFLASASGRYDEVAEDEENIYEPIGDRGTIRSIGSLSSWGEDEFDDDDDAESGSRTIEYPNRPLPPTPKSGGFINRIPSFNNKRNKVDENVDEIPIERVKINLEKHPPPQLPTTPPGLTREQEKKRHVIGCIIKSEKSYIDSLDRIIEEYKEPLLNTYGLNEKRSVCILMSKSQEIVNYHRIFQIELAECSFNWDTKEEIGKIFTASFSRSMVIDAYSTYVNKFSEAMEDIKTAETTKPGMVEFLSNTAKKSQDRLSIFALMVKPIQRFPQFIMFMQDLLKYTPHSHHDRAALQSALTDLENVTHKLNERKRESEQSVLAKSLHVILKSPTFKSRRQIRQDDLEQVDSSASGPRNKVRRLFLMDDSICCCTLIQRSPKETYKVKWITPLQDLELKESTITPEMQSVVKGGHSRVSVQSIVMDRNEDNLFHLYSDMQDMLHDYTILAKMSQLATTLKRPYQNLSVDYFHELCADLQKMIQVKDQQLNLANSSSLILHDSLRKQRCVFQTNTPELKQEWCIDFLMAKLALDPQNNLSWHMSSGSSIESDVIHQPAMYMKWMSVDMPRHYTKVKCAVPVFLSGGGGGGSSGIGIQHLWVVTTSETRAQVSLVSIQTTKPALIESFQAAKAEVITVETVPGFAKTTQDNAFLEDTVWMSTADSQILVYSLFDEDGIRRYPTGARKPRSSFNCHGVATTIRYADDRVFVGLDSGTLIIYDRDEDGAWMIDNPHPVEISSDEAVSSIIAIDDEIWVACGDTIYMIPIDANEFEDKLKCVGGATISEMVRSGCGVWISFNDRSYVHLYYIESKKLLQEINITKTISLMISESAYRSLEKRNKECVVTSLMASRGLLWIGTNLGIVCSFPLPLLRDGVPKINSKPNVSLHSHNSPVQFLLPIYCGTVNLWYKAKGLNSTESVAWRENATLRGHGQRSTQQDSNIVLKQGSKSEEYVNSSDVNVADVKVDGVRKSRSLEDIDKLDDKFNDKVVPKNFNRKSMTLRTELAAKLRMRQQVMENIPSEENEVSMYYGDLVHSGNSEQSISKEDLSKSSSAKEERMTARQTKGNVSELSSTPLNENKWRKKLPSFSSFRSKGSRNKNQAEISENSVSFRGVSNEPRTSRVFDSMQKRNCNAVIVISGGDGYIDWRKASQKNEDSNMEAGLMLWMYKF